jgi:AcrR family transcriptional regulator
MAAARRVFSTGGLQGASIADITEAADVGVGTFYLHFKDKDEVYAAVVQEGIEAVRHRFLDELAGAGDAPAVPTLVRAAILAADDEGDLFRILLTDPASLGAAAMASDLLISMFRDVYTEAEQAGHGSDTPPDLLARMTSGVVRQAVLWRYDHPRSSPDRVADHAVALLRDGLPPALFSPPDDGGPRRSRTR